MCREVIRSVVRFLESEPAAGQDVRRNQVAAAALMVECARMDHRVSDVERREMAGSVGRLFALEPETAEMLVAVAERRAEDVWHDWLFTDAVRRGFGDAERLALLRDLWRVAASNGLPDTRQEAFVRRIGREIGVPEAQVAAAREDDAP